MFGRIYLVTNKINGKQYVGQTTYTLNHRWRGGHCADARKGEKTIICSAIRKYGDENFSVKQIATADSLTELNALEIYYIKTFNTIRPAGYNLDEGGNSRLTHPESRQKLSLAMMGNTNGRFCKGIVKSDETRRKLSVARKGRPSNRKGATHTLEARAKMSASHKGKDLSCNKGRKHSHQSRRNMSLAHLGNRASEETKLKMSLAQKQRWATING
jgi:hypothetical protein